MRQHAQAYLKLLLMCTRASSQLLLGCHQLPRLLHAWLGVAQQNCTPASIRYPATVAIDATGNHLTRTTDHPTKLNACLVQVKALHQ